MLKYYRDRKAAGKVLATKFYKYSGREDVIVLGLPRGGIPIAYEIAAVLGAKLDVFVVHKLGTPGQPELAMGAIAPQDIIILNNDIVSQMHITQTQIQSEIKRQKEELIRREKMYRMDRPPKTITGKTVIVVDDGLATGATMKVAIMALKQSSPQKIIVAVPVGDKEVCTEIGKMADEIICTYTPYPLSAIGWWYEDFSQTPDEEVISLLKKADEKYMPVE